MHTHVHTHLHVLCVFVFSATEDVGRRRQSFDADAGETRNVARSGK